MVRSKCLLCLCVLWLMVAVPGQAAEELYIEAELSPVAPYIQSPVAYRIRLYRALTLSQGSLILPQQEQLVAELLDETPTVNVEREGRLYQLQEWRYLLFPQRSGPLVVEAPVFSGRHAFGRGPELELAVRPAPVAGPWVPAYGLTLSEQWIAPEPPWQVGDLLERVITIEAKGVTGSQLPALPAPTMTGIEIQELGAEVRQQVINGQLVGRRIQRQRLLPLEAGRFELPGITLAWWDLAQDAAREATLPGQTLEFIASAQPVVTAESTAEAPEEAASEPAFAVPGRWIAVALAGLALVLFAASLHRRFLSVEGRHRYRALVLLREVEDACRNSDAQEAVRGLLAWAEHHLGDGTWTLGRLARQLDEAAARALWDLDAHLYRTPTAQWDGAGFAATVLPALRAAQAVQAQRPAQVLPPLNP